MKQTAGGALKTLMPFMAFLFALLIAILYAESVQANRYTSPNYTIDASTLGGTFGGATSSTNYSMTSTGGETIIGNGSGGSYKLTEGYVAQLDKALKLTVQPSGLAAYYPLDEGIGTGINDETTNNNRGSATNGPIWTTGKISQGMSFDGVDDQLEVPNSASLTTSSVTISLWFTQSVASINCDTNNNWRSLIRKGLTASTPNGWSVILEENGRLQFDVGLAGVSSRSGIANAGITLGAPIFLTFTYDATTGGQKIYANGVEILSKANTPTAITGNSSPLIIAGGTNSGSCPVSSGYAPGVIDEVKIFSRSLTAAEIKAEYDANNTAVPAGLAFTADLIPNTPQNLDAQAVIQTDAPGYSLSISQNQNLTSGGNTISAINNGGTIGTPAAWVDGTTKGLGFTLTGTNATAIPVEWGSGGSYAAVPGTATSFYTRTGYTAGSKDTLNIRFRVDIPTTQPAGSYTNTVTYTGTMTP